MLFRCQSAWLLALLLVGCATRQPSVSSIPSVTLPCDPSPEPPKKFGINCALKVKGGTLEELHQAMKGAQTCFGVKVEPLGLRLFDIPQAGLAFDTARQELQVRLNNSLCAKQQVALTGAVARVAISSLDCVLFFDVDTKSGVARQQARFEVDYVLSATLGPPFSEWHDLALQINDQSADWSEFIGDGLKFDWLPRTIKIKITGTDADGRRLTADCSTKNQTLSTLLQVPVREAE
jgi:hypothetical protein